MDLHPIPRQITTFEFKLIGFMTVKQFGFVLLAGVFGYLFFLAIPIQIVNIAVGVLIFSVGLLFAFVPINERPLDVFLTNLVRRLSSPTQYIFQKHNIALKIFDELYFESNPHVILAHADSKEKLASYLTAKKQGASAQNKVDPRRVQIRSLLTEKLAIKPPTPNAKAVQGKAGSLPERKPALNPESQRMPKATKHPVISGIAYNKRHIPLPGVLLYIRDTKTNNVLRILKTNPHGVFATFNPLPDGEYLVELVDSSGGYLFDKSSIFIKDQAQLNLEFTSKEMI